MSSHATEAEPIVELADAAVWEDEQGNVHVTVTPEVMGWNTGYPVLLSEDDAWALQDALRRAAALVHGKSPQRVIRFRIADPVDPEAVLAELREVQSLVPQ